jgi:hypothetical protein
MFGGNPKVGKIEANALYIFRNHGNQWPGKTNPKHLKLSV